jgi:4-alpha-glucanotransferase
MRYVNEQIWEIGLDVPQASYPKTPVSYYFLLRNPDGSTREDFGNDRKLDFAALGGRDTIIIDSWNDLEKVENVFFTEPFRKVLAKIEQGEPKPKALGGTTHTFHVKAPLLPAGQTVCLLGQAMRLEIGIRTILCCCGTTRRPEASAPKSI